MKGEHLITHGLSKHPLYRVWHRMKMCCTNPNKKEYINYGGRGICLCVEWFSYPGEFIKWSERNGWKLGLEIDRIDNNGNYEPSNCRFVTRQVNVANRGVFKNNRLGVTGVHLKNNGRYLSKAQYKDKKYYRTFDTICEAALERSIWLDEQRRLDDY